MVPDDTAPDGEGLIIDRDTCKHFGVRVQHLAVVWFQQECAIEGLGYKVRAIYSHVVLMQHQQHLYVGWQPPMCAFEIFQRPRLVATMRERLANVD